ncbi:MAG: hypothetical protein ACP5GZ_11955, partial [Vulcanisaeta sp.]
MIGIEYARCCCYCSRIFQWVCSNRTRISQRPLSVSLLIMPVLPYYLLYHGLGINRVRAIVPALVIALAIISLINYSGFYLITIY